MADNTLATNDDTCVPRAQSGDSEFTLYFEGDELYAAMLSAIARANTSICLESYIFASDEIGWRFARALAARAEAGVEVKLHLDAAGFLVWGSTKLNAWLHSKPIQIRIFHRWRWRDPIRYNQRNHRKLLIIDNARLYMGGFNIHRESSYRISGEARWRDTHLCLTGAIVQPGRILFDDFWKGKRRRWPIDEQGVNTLLPNFNSRCRQVLKCIYSSHFAHAQHTINLTTPYFVPDFHTQKNLQRAARRGVNVRLLVPRKNDQILVQWASRAAYAKLLDAGVHIYEYLPRMLHAKTTMIDGTWAMIGTANLDYRSLFVNHEIILTTGDQALCGQLNEQFNKDLEDSEEIRLDQWANRPWKAHIAELIGWLARRWL